MRVLQIIQRAQLRGAEMFTCQLCVELRKLGVSVDVAVLFSDRGELLNKFSDLNFIFLRGNPSIRFFDLSTLRALNKLIRFEKYDIVQANAGDTLKYAAISRFLFRWQAKLVYRNANKMSDFVRGKFHLFVNKWLLAQADYFISVSEICKKDLNALFPPSRKRSSTITIGTYLFDQVASIEVLERPVIINIGSFVPEKNHTFLLQVFTNFLKQYGHGILWFVGDGKLRGEIEDHVQSRGISDKVVFWGFRDDAISLLKSADVLVMPSRIEGLPGAILESLACRIPVLASNVGGISEVLKDGVTGIVIEDFDVGKYTARLLQIIEDKEYRNKILYNGRSLIESNYLLPEVSQKFLMTYDHLVKETAIDMN